MILVKYSYRAISRLRPPNRLEIVLHFSQTLFKEPYDKYCFISVKRPKLGVSLTSFKVFRLDDWFLVIVLIFVCYFAGSIGGVMGFDGG